MPSLLAQLGDARDEVMKMDWVSIAKTMTTEDVAALAERAGLGGIEAAVVRRLRGPGHLGVQRTPKTRPGNRRSGRGVDRDSVG